MKPKNDFLLSVFMAAMLVNVVTVSFIVDVALHGYEYEQFITRFLEYVSNPLIKISLAISGFISLIGIIIGATHFKYLGQLNRLDIIESELQQEKEKYRLATEQFKEFQKTKSIQ